MTNLAFPPTAHRAAVGLLLAVALAPLSACGGGSSTAQGPVVTVTLTPTVTVSVAPRPATTTATTKAGVARSDVVGRKFDLGTIVRVEADGGVPVLIFDRWTAPGVADSKLGADGVPIVVHSDVRYQNLNTKNTFRIPVAQGSAFTYNHCVAVDQPAQQKSSTLQEFTRLKDAEKIMLLTLDSQGRLVAAQNDPAC